MDRPEACGQQLEGGQGLVQQQAPRAKAGAL
jgi:hypothetical protein